MAHVIGAVPLKPAARIVQVNPSLFAPHRLRLTGVNAKVIQRAIALSQGEPGASKPGARKLAFAIGHVLAAERAELHHFGRRQFRAKFRIEIAADGSRNDIAIISLHLVVHCDDFFGLVVFLCRHDCRLSLRIPSVIDRQKRTGPFRARSRVAGVGAPAIALQRGRLHVNGCRSWGGLATASCSRTIICDGALPLHNATAGMSAMRCGQDRHTTFGNENHIRQRAGFC